MRLLIAIICVTPLWLMAQSEAESNAVTTTGEMWNEVNVTHAIKRVVVEAGFYLNTANTPDNRGNLLNYVSQVGTRGFAHYYITPRIKLTGSIGFWQNYSAPEMPKIRYNEIRPMIQAQHFIVRKRFTIYNRFRMEDRFIQDTYTLDYNSKFRFRYMPKVIIGINSKIVRQKTLYAIVLDEVFATAGNDGFIDQNRFSAGFGYCFTNDFVVELYYSNQQRFNTTAANNTINAIGLTFNINNIVNLLKAKKSL
jgi:hypothetical protein